MIWEKNFDKRLFSSTGLFMDWKLQTGLTVCWGISFRYVGLDCPTYFRPPFNNYLKDDKWNRSPLYKTDIFANLCQDAYMNIILNGVPKTFCVLLFENLARLTKFLRSPQHLKQGFGSLTKTFHCPNMQLLHFRIQDLTKILLYVRETIARQSSCSKNFFFQFAVSTNV